jgi:predicted dehydrogenase
VLQVGAGQWGASWAQLVASTRGVRLAGLVDARPVARRTADGLGVPSFATLRTALDRVGADVVLVATPPDTHVALVEEALGAGLHVLCEKPLAHTMPEAIAIADAADRAGRSVMVAQNYRFRRQPTALRSLVADGVLGSLVGVAIAFSRDLRRIALPPGDWRRTMAHPLLLDMTVHHVDLLRAVTGSEVERVEARGWRAPDSPFAGVTSVTALLTLAGDVPVSYVGSWTSAAAETSWNGSWELVGEHGRALWSGGVVDRLRGRVSVAHGGGPPVPVALPRLVAADRRGVLRELRRAILRGDVPACSAADNLATLAVVHALVRSVDEGRPVDVAEVRR